LLPLVRIKHNKDFTWGIEQKEAFERIKEYLTKPPVIQAPKNGRVFRLYIAASDGAIGAMLAQENKGKEGAIAYLSRRLQSAETRYTQVEKLCLSLYYACSKFRHYVLASPCIVVCRHDVVKHMMQRPILSGRMGKWAYSLVEYELAYESLKAARGQVIADHGLDSEDIHYVEKHPQRLFFDGSVCSRGCGIGYVIISPGGVVQERSVCLEVEHTNNQAEYRALAAGLEALVSMGVKDVEAHGDSQLVVQQVLGESQCSNSTLNQYLELCKQLVRGLDTFSIRHVGREDNKAANRLAQQASGYEVRRGKISVLEETISCGAINADESAVTRENNTTDEDWRVTLQRCIMDPGGMRDRKVL
jgi:ribonuclease HI